MAPGINDQTRPHAENYPLQNRITKTGKSQKTMQLADMR